MNESCVVQTYTSKSFDIVNPTTETIVIRDIAHSLFLKCRFGGHSTCFYSVAQHSLLVADLLYNLGEKPIYGLLHDAAEAYVGDMSRPFRHLLQRKYKCDIGEVENNILKKLYEKIDVPFPNADDWKMVKLADNMALYMEANIFLNKLIKEWKFELTKEEMETARSLTDSRKLLPLLPLDAENMFMGEFKNLTGIRRTWL